MAQTLTRRIARAQYLQILSELRQIATAVGYKLVIYYRPVIWNRYGSDGPNFGEVRGACYVHTNKRITVTVFGRTARRKMLAVVAHEVRHALHANRGLFSGYYEENTEAWNAALGKPFCLPEDFTLPDLDEALAAEKDCDLWAEEFLTASGIEPPKHLYPFDSTNAYELHRRLAKRQPQLYLRLAGAAPERLRSYHQPIEYREVLYSPKVASGPATLSSSSSLVPPQTKSPS